MITTLLVTGPSGAGKSKLLAQNAQPGSGVRPYVIDPLGTSRPVWHEPDPAQYDVVAFDHVWHLEDAATQVESAYAWCTTHGKDLWLIDQSHSDMARVGVQVARDAIELRFMHSGSPKPFRLLQHDEVLGDLTHPELLHRLTGVRAGGR